MEKILDDQVVKQINEAFTQLKEPVQILFFGSRQGCEYCEEALQLLEEVAATSNKVGVTVYDIQMDKEIADQYKVDKAPTFVIAARDGEQVSNFGVQFSGIPSGYEFSTLINDVMIVSSRDSGLSPEVREFLSHLNQPLLLQVFVTPTCPYCPRAVLLAHQMAMENPTMIRAEGVEATEFQNLASQFHVQGVPQTVINSGAGTVVGAVPEQGLIAAIQHAFE